MHLQHLAYTAKTIPTVLEMGVMCVGVYADMHACLHSAVHVYRQQSFKKKGACLQMHINFMYLYVLT